MESEVSSTVLWASMRLCEERRDYKALRGHVMYDGNRLAADLDERELREFCRLLLRAVAAWRYEEQNGEGVLLDKKHRLNVLFSTLDDIVEV